MTRGALTRVGHNGGTAGYSTYVAFDPNTRAGVVVLANSGGFEFADKIGRELLDPERRPSVARPTQAQPVVVAGETKRPLLPIPQTWCGRSAFEQRRLSGN